MTISNSQLLRVVKSATAVCFIFPAIATLGLAAGSEDFGATSAIPWSSLIYCVISTFMPWLIYFYYRKTDKIIANGYLVIVSLLAIFSVFGFLTNIFYFAFSPLHFFIKIIALLLTLGVMAHWGWIIAKDVLQVLHKKNMYTKAYILDGDAFYYESEFIQEFEKKQAKREPFKTVHLWVALALTPFVYILNRILTPVVGSGHGIFLVLSFFGLPLSLFIIGVAVRSYILMIHYPKQIERTTGKLVLMRGF